MMQMRQNLCQEKMTLRLEAIYDALFFSVYLAWLFWVPAKCVKVLDT